MDADGSNPVRLTTGNKVDERPDWSPDGSSITFSRNGKDIWSMDADGSNQTRLTESKRIEFGSVYSPDGTMIAFDREGPNDRFGVWVMPTDGSAATKLSIRQVRLLPRLAARLNRSSLEPSVLMEPLEAPRLGVQ